MDNVVKTELGLLVSAEQRVLVLCQSNQHGIDQDVLTSDPVLSQYGPQHCVDAINKLISAKQLETCSKKDKLIWRIPVSSPLLGSVLQNAEVEEKLVYKVIYEHGNKGVWRKTIQQMTNIPTQQLTKLLKSMEGKKFIKLVRSVNLQRKPLYMLYDIQPDASITGGAWFNKNKFDSEFANILNTLCYQCLEMKANEAKNKFSNPVSQHAASVTTAADVLDYVTKSQVSKIELQISDIEKVLETLIYDGKVKAVVSCTSSTECKQYRLQNPLVPTIPLMRIPCGVCPVVDMCHEDGEVSPATCIYMKEWLDKAIKF